MLFQGNSRSYTPQPSVFRGVEALFVRRQTLQTLPSNPSAGLSKATLAFKGVQDCRLPAFKPFKPSRRPSAGLSKATLAATRPSHLFFRALKLSLPAVKRFKPFLQTLPQAFPRQLSHLRAFKTAVCPPSNPSNPPAGLLQAFPRQLSQLHALAIWFSQCWSSIGPPSNASNPSFKPFRRPFQGNPRSYTPQPSVFKGVQDCRLPAFKPLKPSRRPFAGLSKATLAATRPSHLFFRFPPFLSFWRLQCDALGCC